MRFFERLRLGFDPLFAWLIDREPRRPVRPRLGATAAYFARPLEPRRVLNADASALQQFTVAENAAAGTVVGTVEPAQPQTDPSQPLTFSIVAGNPSNAFLIVPNSGEIQVQNPDALNFETSPEWQLTIGTQRPGETSPSSTQVVTIHLLDVYAPSVVQLAGGEAVLSLVDGRVQVAQAGDILFNAPAEDVSALSILGSANADHLIVDLSNGNPIPVGGLFYDGGDQPPGTVDAVEMRGAVDSADYRYDNANDGGITLTQAGVERTIEYRNLEPVVNTGTVNSAVFTLSAGDDVAVLELVSGNTLRLRSVNGTFETTTFTAPTVSLTIRTGAGNDDLTITSLNADFRARLILDGQTGADDHIAINTALTLGGGTGNANGDLTVTAERIDVTQAINTTAGSSGDVAFTAGTKLTLSAAADISTKGTVTVNGGAVETAADVTTTGDLIRINAPATLTADVTLTTNGGKLEFDGPSATVDGPHRLTVSTGAADAIFDAAVGSVTPLTGLEISSARNVVFAAPLSTGAAGIELTSTGTMELTGVTTSGGGGVTATNGGVLTLNGALTLDGALVQNGAGRTDLQADVTTTGDDVTIGGPLRLTANAAVTTAGGAVRLQNTVDGSAQLTVSAGAGNVRFDGAIGDATRLTGLQVSSAQDVTFNSTVKTAGGGLAVTATGKIDFTAGVSTTNSGAVTLSHGGALTIPGAADFDLAGAFSETGGGAVHLGGDITTTADPVTFQGPVSLTGDASVKTAGGTVEFQNTVDGDYLLSLTAGVGDASFAGAVGSTTPLSGLNVVSARDVTFAQGLRADDQGIQLKATGKVDLNGPVTTTNGGALTVTNTGVLSVNGAVNLDGVLLQNGVGRTDLGADATTTGDAVTFGGPVNLTAAATLTTAGGNVTFQGKVDGGQPLTIAAGTGDVAFQQQVGSVARVTGIQITSADAVSFDRTVSLAGGGLQLTNSGTVALKQAVDATAGGGVTIANGGLLTVLGNLNLDGGFTQNGAGSVQLSADVTTTGDAVAVQSATTLGADVAVSTAGGDVRFQNTVDGGQLLTITAGTGNVQFDGALGGTTPLDGLKIVSAQDVTLTSVTVQDRDLAITSAGKINLTGPVTTQVGGLTTLNNGGELTVGANLNLDGAFDQSGPGPVKLGGAVTTTGDAVTFHGATTLTADVTLTTNGGKLEFDGPSATVDGPHRLTVSTGAADAIFDAAVGSVTPLTGLEISSARNVVFAAPLSTGAAGIELTSTGTMELTGVTTSGGGGVTATNGGVLTLNGALTLDGALVQNGAGRTDLQADVTTTGDDVTIGGPLRLTANAAVTTAGGAVRLQNTVDGSAQLTVSAGAGNVRFDGAIGDATRLTGLQVSSAQDVTFNSTVKTAGGGLAVTATGKIDFTAGVSTTNSGAVTLSHGGALTIPGAADFDLAGAFSETGGGAVHLGGDITTTADPVTFQGPVSLTGDASVKTAGGTVEFQNTVDGDYLLSLTAGVGDASFAGAVGSTTPLSGLNVVSARDVTFAQGLRADDQGIQLKATGKVDLNGPVTTTNGGALTVTNTGVLSVNGAVNLDGVLLQNGVGRTDLGADATTTGDAVTFGGPVNLTAAATLTTAGGNVTFQGKVDGGQPLTIAAGTGDVAFQQQVGSVARVTGIQITSADAVSFDRTVSLAGGGLQLTNSGTVALKQAVDATAGGGVTIANGGLLTVLGNLNLDGGFTQNGAGSVQLSADVTTTGDAVAVQSATTLGADVAVSTAGGDVRFQNTVDGGQLLTITAGTGNVQFDGALGGTTPLDGLKIVSAQDVTLTSVTVQDRDLAITSAGKINLTGPVTTQVGGLTTLNNGGELTVGANLNLDGAFDQSGPGPVKLGGAVTTTGDAVTFHGATTLTADVTLTTNGGKLEFDGPSATVDGPHRLTVSTGAADAIFDAAVGSVTPLTGLEISSARNVVFAAPLSTGAAGIELTSTGTMELTGVTTSGGGGVTATNGGVLTLNGALTLDGALVQNGAGRTDLQADVTTTGDDVTFQTAVRVQAAATLTTAGGDVQFQSTVDGPAHLAIAAAAGKIDFLGTVGSTNRLDGITVASSGGIDFRQTVNLNSGGLDLTSADYVKFAAKIDLNQNGSVRIDNAGLLSIPDAADFTIVAGGFAQVGSGSVLLGGDIKTANDAVLFNGAVTLAPNAAGKVVIDTGAIGGNVTFAGTVDAATAGVENLQIDAAGGNVRFGGAVGGNAALGDVTIVKANDLTVAAAFQADTLTHIRGTGTTVFDGATTLNAATGMALDLRTTVVNVNAAVASNGGALDLSIDDLAIDPALGSLSATPNGNVTIVTKTAAREIDLGLGTAVGKLGLSAAELDRITAAVLKIGDGRAGSIDLSAAIAPTGTPVLHLHTGGNVAGNGTVAVPQLAVQAVGDVNLGNANDVDRLAIAVSGTGTHISFRDADGVTLDRIDGVTGLAGIITNGGNATLQSGGLLNQTADGNLSVVGLQLLGDGPVQLNNTTNAVDVLAASLGGSLSLRDQGTLQVGTVQTFAAATTGVTTTDDDVTLQSGDTLTLAAAVDVGTANVKLTSDAGAIDDPDGAATKVFAAGLALSAQTGIGVTQALQTEIGMLAATNGTSGRIAVADRSGALLTVGTTGGLTGITSVGAGGTMLTHVGPLSVAASITDAGGGISLTTTTNGGDDDHLELSAPLLVQGGSGNISLTAGTDLLLHDTGVLDDVRVAGSGSIFGTAGRNVVFDSNVRLRSATGAIENIPPQLTNVAGPQIQNTGAATVGFDYGRVQELNFTAVINWGDGVVDTYSLLPPGSTIVGHTYTGNPNILNPAAPIPVTVTLNGDARIHLLGFESTTVQILLQFPGDGVKNVRIDTTPKVPVLTFPQLVRNVDAALPVTVTIVRAAVDVSGGSATETVKTAERVLILREVLPDGREGSSVQFSQSLLDNLSAVFGKLRDGRYRLYLFEPETQTQRMTMEVYIRDGKPTSLEGAEQGGADTTDGAQLPPPGETPSESSTVSAVEAEEPVAESESSPHASAVPAAAAAVMVAATGDWNARVDAALARYRAYSRLRTQRRREQTAPRFKAK